MATGRPSPYIDVPGGSGSPNRTASGDSPSPSIIFAGRGLLDVRLGYNRGPNGAYGVGVGGAFRCMRQAPATLGTAKIAALAHVTSGVAMTLANASTGITILAAALTVYSNYGNPVPANALVLDGNPGIVNFGLANSAGRYNMNWYDPTKTIARAVSVTGVTSGAGGAFLVSGRDVYGYPQTETITAGAGVNTVNGKKAFKFITSVVPQFTDAHNYSIGTTDIFGLPLRCDNFPDTLIWWNDALITANTGFVAADTTNPATAATGDTRGTYAVQDASDGTKVLTTAIFPGLTRFTTAAGMFGVTPA